MRKKLNELFKPFNSIVVKSAESNDLLVHACGTSHMSKNPSENIVNIHNQIHGVENLYVFGGSFFPTSGGTNPALTIAATSLGVADHFLKQNVKSEAL